MSAAHTELEKQLKELKRKFDAHVDAYLANVQMDLKLTIENLKNDYSIECEPTTIHISHESLDRIFITGKHALKDTIDAFYDKDIPDHEFESTYELAEYMEGIQSEMALHLREDGEEDVKSTADQLKLAYERLSMGVNSEIDNIIKLTNDLIEVAV